MKGILQKKYSEFIIKPILIRYLKKTRLTRVLGFKLEIPPTVFHPKFFFSSIYLTEFVEGLDIRNKNFLDLGCGSGIIGLMAYKKGANTLAVDINQIAVECTTKNYSLNFEKPDACFKAIQSDLFSSISAQKFSVIAINPPYFFNDVKEDVQLAWNCGKNGEYFTRLFSEMKDFVTRETEIYMVLADNCDIERIEQIAEKCNFSLVKVTQKKIKWETNFIFKITAN